MVAEDDPRYSLERLRDLGTLERYTAIRHPLHVYTNVAVTAWHRLPAGHDIAPGQDAAETLKRYIYGALSTMISRHSILSCIAVDEDTEQSYFARLPSVDLEKTVRFVTRQTKFDFAGARDKELDVLLQNEHNTDFLESAKALLPFWRLVVLTDPVEDGNGSQEFAVVFTYHHALSDGTGGKVFQRDFATALSNAKPSAATKITPPQTPILPPLEEMHPLPVTWFYLLKAAIFDYFPFLDSKKGIWLGDKSCQTPSNIHFRSFWLSAAAGARFRTACKKNGTTITGGLQTYLAAILFQLLPQSYTKLICSTPFAMRRFIEQTPDANGIPTNWDDDALAIYVSAVSETYQRSAFTGVNNHSPDKTGPTPPLLPWSEARRTRKNLSAVLAQGGTNVSVALLKYVRSFRDIVVKKIGGPHGNSFEVSNLGVVKTPHVSFDVGASKSGAEADLGDAVPSASASPPYIGRMLFSQCAGVTGEALNFSTVTGGDGCLGFGIAWQDGVVDPEMVEELISIVLKGLEEGSEDSY